jgi:hypothetical protein
MQERYTNEEIPNLKSKMSPWDAFQACWSFEVLSGFLQKNLQQLNFVQFFKF